ncbi:MAG: immunoglobulin-like domain-containing protein, partial [Patescibacteria group bacterium]
MKNKLSSNFKKIISYTLAPLIIFSNFAFFPTVKAVATPTLTIGSQSASNGATINVPLNASHFDDVAGITLTGIQFDNTLLSYIGYTLNTLPVSGSLINLVENQININWSDLSNPLKINNDSLLTLNFTVISTAITNANLTFAGTKEINDSNGNPIATTFTDGVITLNPDETVPEITAYTLQVSGEEPTQDNNAIFSPNDDGIKDTVAIDLAFSEEVDYEINIKSGESTVKSWSGQATNPNAKIWDGEGSLGDGIYAIEVIITDEAENSITDNSKTITLDITAPVITLNGGNPVTIEVGTVYNDAGATANDNYDGNITANIITVNLVNTNVIGAYTVSYNVTDSSGNQAVEITRTVNVVDTTKPVITLLGDNPINLYIGDTYTDAGATASDNYDGDITASIVTVGLPINTAFPGVYDITYNVSDAAGNAATEVIRTVNVVDITTPIITLLGENLITIEVGTIYTDAGATASDDVDGDITNNIITVNSVNSTVIGAYTVTYNVTDSSGN